MNLKQKVLLLATVPLILSVSIISLFVTYQAKSLSNAEIAAFERSMLTAKKSELLNYLNLAQTSIRHVYEEASANDELAKSRVREILNALTYGPDGYFFVYDFKGNNIVHPKQKHRVGKNWWDLRDPQGNFVIRHLIERAKEGGGFHRYIWEKPSTGQSHQKISYAIALEKWGWMLGTGLYIDDVTTQMRSISIDVANRIRQTSIIILVITVISLILVFITGIIINLHERRMADEKLKELTHRIVDTQEEERWRVARELHDGISQTLVSVKYALEMALKKSDDKTDTSTFITKGADRLNMAIKEVRRISHGLRPSVLDDLGLSPALESLASEFAEGTGIKVELNTVAFRNLLPKEVKTALFRVAQEALTNIERHSSASVVVIKLTVSGGFIILTITDNGTGFDTGHLNSKKHTLGGIGIRNMQERLEYYNGSLAIQSSEEGTKIIAKLPKKLMHTDTAIEIDAHTNQNENTRIAS